MNDSFVTNTHLTSVGNMQFPTLGSLTAVSVAAMARPQGLACGDLDIGDDTSRRDHLAADDPGDGGGRDTAGLGQVLGAGVAPVQGELLDVAGKVLQLPHDRIVCPDVGMRPAVVAPNRSLGGKVGSHETTSFEREEKDEPPKSKYSEVYAVIDTLTTRGLLPPTTPTVQRNRKRVLATYFCYMRDRWYDDIDVDGCIYLLRDGGKIRTYLQARTADLSKSSLNATRRLLNRCASHVIGLKGELEWAEELPEVFYPAATAPRRAYNASELIRIDDWVHSRPRRESRRVACIIVSLALGAGMSTEEIYHCRYGDFTDFGTVLAVHARGGRGIKPRTVPLTAPFDDLMRPVLHDVGADRRDEPLVKPHSVRRRNDATGPHLIPDFIHRTSDNPSSTGLAPTLPRLRYTWIADHAAERVDFDQLVYATGNIQPFTHTFRNMIVESGALTETEYREWISGSRDEPDYPPLRLVEANTGGEG